MTGVESRGAVGSSKGFAVRQRLVVMGELIRIQYGERIGKADGCCGS